MNALLATVALLPLYLPKAPAATGGPETQPSQAPATQPTTQPSIATESVHRGTLTTAVDGQGWFEPVDAQEVRIRPKAYAGELLITQIVPNGSNVKKGDVVLQFDPATFNKQLAAALNEQAAAHAGLTKSETDAKIGEESEALMMKEQIEATKMAVDEIKWWNEMEEPQMLKIIELNLKSYRAFVDDQQDELDQLKKLYKNDDLSNDTADIVVKRAVRQLELSKASLKMQEERSEKSKTVTIPLYRQRVLDSAKQAEEQLESLKAAQAQAKVLRETGMASAKANVAAIDQRVDELKADQEKLTVKAAADGVVCYGQLNQGMWTGGDPRALKVGERAAPQQVLMTVWTPAKMRLAAGLPEAKFFELHPGLKATVTPVAFSDQKLEGKCDAAPPTVTMSQQGPQYAMTIELKDVDNRLVPGMRANFHVDAPQADNVVLVPNSALHDGCVWIKTKDGQREKRTVVTGKTDGKHTEIKQGLSEGDEIFTEAQHG